MMKCVIMAGGKGTRLWPISRKNKPKQFQAIVSDKTMLQETYLRLRKKFEIADIYISTNKEYVSEVEREILEIPKENIISEPIARGTASSVALVVAIILAKDPDAIISVFPADHIIQKEDVFLKAIDTSKKFLQNNKKHIVAFGIIPHYPETGYGYIKKGKDNSKNKSKEIFSVKRFVEKPDATTAQEYIDKGGFYWNSAMYMFFAEAMREKFSKYLPDTFKRIDAISEAVKNNKYEVALKKEYPQMDKINLEYAIIENDSHIAVMPLDLGWSDVGSWASLKDSLVNDTKKHFVKGEHIDFGSENLLVYGSKKLITTIGVKDLIIVDAEDAILVCDRNKSQMVSDVVKRLEESNKIKKVVKNLV